MEMPRGLRAKGTGGIEIEIRFKGKRYRPTLSLDPSLKRNINAAEASYRTIRDVIAREKIGRATEAEVLKVIRENVCDTFNFSGSEQHGIPSISDILSAWLKTKRISSANSTMSDFSSQVNEFEKLWGSLAADKLTIQMLREWILKSQEQGRTLKTIKNRVIPLRGAFDNIQDIVPLNPVSAIKWKQFKPTESERLKKREKKIFPFAWDEINALLLNAVETVQNLLVVCFGLGLRINEVLALAWEDIDLNLGRITITRGIVRHRLTTLKTEESNDTINLNEFPHVWEALRRQKAHTFMKSAVDCGLYGKLHFIFYNPLTDKPYGDSETFLDKIWIPLLRKAGVRERTAKQMRHTFAVQARVSGKPDLWTAKILRHTTTQMIEQNYAKEWPTGGTEEEVRQQFDIERWKVSDQIVTKRSSN